MLSPGVHNSSKDKYIRHRKKAEMEALRANCLFCAAAISKPMHMLFLGNLQFRLVFP